MSSTLASSAVGTPSPSSSPGPAVEPSGPPPLLSSQASLYLYTFLVTLVLLLAVSGAIVTRSVILRRRHRRLVEEAIRNGTYVPPASRVRRRLGERPVLHDAFLGLGAPADDADEKAATARSAAVWEDVVPVSVQLLHRDRSPDADTTDRAALVIPPAAPRSWRHTLFTVPVAFLIRAFGFPTSRDVPRVISAATAPTVAAEKANTTITCAMVSVIIAMPRPPLHKPAQRPPTTIPPSLPGLSARLPLLMADEEPSEPLPPLEIGIAAVPTEKWKEGDFEGVTNRTIGL